MIGVSSGHHVLSIEHLLSKFGNSNGAVLLTAMNGQRSKTSDAEVETGKWN